jgi:hypothetical protein
MVLGGRERQLRRLFGRKTNEANISAKPGKEPVSSFEALTNGAP